MSSTQHSEHRLEKGDSHSFNDEKVAKNEEGKSQGVLTAEALRTLKGWPLWVLYVGIAFTAYVYGLDNNTMYAYITQASNGGDYILYGTASVIQQVLIAVGKFPIAKLSDVFGRAQGYAISLAFYVIGFIIIASSQKFADTCGGVVFYALGNSGTQIMQQIVVADAVNTRWRGLAIGLLSLPYIINFAVASKITQHFVTDIGNWRWGPGVFAIIMPVAISPIIFSLALAQQKAKKEQIAGRHPYRVMGFKRGAISFFHDVDVGGLFLLCAGWLLILLPLTLWSRAPEGWKSGYIIAMLVLGGVFLIATGLYEWLFAREPIIRKRFILNKDVIGPGIAAFFDFYSFYLSWSGAYTFVIVLKNWSIGDATYFSNAQSLALTVFGIGAGGLNIWFSRYKWTFFVGGAVRMLGLGLMIAYRHAGTTTAQLVIPQILQGLGGGILGIELTVAAQVSVPHQDVALVSALILLMAEIGGACGTATWSAVQAQIVPKRLAQLLPGNTAAQTAIFSSPLTAAISYPLGTPERDAMIAAWSEYQRVLLIIGIVMSAVPIIIIPFLSDHKLNKSQNVVEYNENDEKVNHLEK
ncbi:unnamed protein product [Parajaminaea phylloscopi]